MRNVIVFTNLTLDGVMQAPGRPDEDSRDGFEYGGWATPYQAMMEAGDGNMASDLLFGRRTYEDFYSFWPKQTNNPFTDILNNARKYVASTTLAQPLAWENSILLKGDIAAEVARIKQEPGLDILVMGSGDLSQTLIAHNLVDTYVLLIHPLVLGTGRHLFPDGGVFKTLQLVDSKTTTKGVIIATYVPAEA